jgi:hypothetical protein
MQRPDLGVLYLANDVALVKWAAAAPPPPPAGAVKSTTGGAETAATAAAQAKRDAQNAATRQAPAIAQQNAEMFKQQQARANVNAGKKPTANKPANFRSSGNASFDAFRLANNLKPTLGGVIAATPAALSYENRAKLNKQLDDGGSLAQRMQGRGGTTVIGSGRLNKDPSAPTSTPGGASPKQGTSGFVQFKQPPPPKSVAGGKTVKPPSMWAQVARTGWTTPVPGSRSPASPPAASPAGQSREQIDAAMARQAHATGGSVHTYTTAGNTTRHEFRGPTSPDPGAPAPPTLAELNRQYRAGEIQ